MKEILMAIALLVLGVASSISPIAFLMENVADGVDKEKAEQKRRHYHAVALFRLYGVYLYEIA